MRLTDEHDHHGEHAPPPSAHHGRKHGGEHEHEEGVPEWMVSFADNTALMMGFFVILLALNLGPKGTSSAAESQSNTQSQAARESGQSVQELDWAIGVRKAFNNPINPFSTDPRDRILAMRVREQMGLAQTQGIQGPHDESHSLKPSDYFNLVAEVGFEPQSATLHDAGRRKLDELTTQALGNRFIYEIRGHIDFAEITDQEAPAMQLAFSRALAVADYLAQRGVAWHQMKLLAMGTSDPALTRAYKDNEHAVNRRVEIIQTEEIMKQ